MSARARTRQDRESLEGITLLRYVHIYRDRTSGGAEQYLRQLNRGLLTRHGMTILQMHLVNGDETSLVADSTGYLVDAGDHDALARRIKDLLEDPVKQARMGQAGRRFVLDRFSVAAMVARHEQFYSTLLMGHN